MKFLRVIDARTGSKGDYPAELLPRIGERIVLDYGTASAAQIAEGGHHPTITRHYFRVKDVMYLLDNSVEHQAAILVEEEENGEPWPS